MEKIEETIRQYLLVACSLIFGPYHLRIHHYPLDVKKYITKVTPSTAISYESYNEFENLNRGQYRRLFTQLKKSSNFYNHVIRPIIANWDSRDLDTFFKLFGDFNVISGHIKKISVEDARKDAPTFFRLACRLISEMSRRLRDLVMLLNTVFNDKNKTYFVFGYQFIKNQEIKRIASIDEIDDLPKYMYKHKITNDLFTNGISKIMENSDNIFGSVEINLLDIEETRIKLGMNYLEAIPLIANYYANTKINILPLYGTNICVLRI